MYTPWLGRVFAYTLGCLQTNGFLKRPVTYNYITIRKTKITQSNVVESKISFRIRFLRFNPVKIIYIARDHRVLL